MKTKLLILAVGLVGGLGVVGGQALAQPSNYMMGEVKSPPPPPPAFPDVRRPIANNLSGTISVTPTKPNYPLENFSCSDLVVYVTSRATTPAPAGGFFDTPKWTRHVHASGTWSSGTCSYSILVPAATGVDLPSPCPGKVCTGPVGWNDQNAFNLTVQPYGHVPTYPCPLILGVNTPASPWMSVPKGQSKSYALSALGTPMCESLK